MGEDWWNGYDDDGDGKIDEDYFYADGIDNDGDGEIDENIDGIEDQWTDGVDNDQNGNIDYATEMRSQDDMVPGSDIEILINEADAHLN